MWLWRVVLFYVLIENVSLSNGTSQTQNQTTLEMHNNDWSQVNSSNAYFGPVTDERWQKFASPKRKTVRLYESISFSLSVKGNFSFIIISENPIDYKYFTLIRNKINLKEENVSENSWFHYTLTKENNGVALRSCKNDEKIATTFKPFRIGFDVPTDVIIHNYDFHEANWIPGQNKISYVDIPVVDDPYLFISTFVSVDKGCYLKLILEMDNGMTHYVIEGFNEDSKLKTWKKLDINVNSNGTLYFVRERQDTKENGYWAIDDIKYVKRNFSSDSVFVLHNASSSKYEYELTIWHTKNDETIMYNSTSRGDESVNCAPPSNLSIHLSAKPNAIGLTFNSTSCYNFSVNIANLTFENHTSDFRNNYTFPVEQGEYEYVNDKEQSSNVCETFESKNKRKWINKKIDLVPDILNFTTDNSFEYVVYIGNKSFVMVFVMNTTHYLNISSALCTTNRGKIVLKAPGILASLVILLAIIV